MVDEADLSQLTLLESNLSTEVGLIVLDMMAEFTRQYRVCLCENKHWFILWKCFFGGASTAQSRLILTLVCTEGITNV